MVLGGSAIASAAASSGGESSPSLDPDVQPHSPGGEKTSDLRLMLVVAGFAAVSAGGSRLSGSRVGLQVGLVRQFGQAVGQSWVSGQLQIRQVTWVSPWGSAPHPCLRASPSRWPHLTPIHYSVRSHDE